MREDVEVFGDEPGDPIYQVKNVKQTGEFDVLVPDLPGAETFSLHGPRPKARKPHGSSKQLLAHDFVELRRFGTTSPEREEKNDGEARS